MRSGSTETSIATSKGACIWVKVAMISRQICSTVASGSAALVAGDEPAHHVGLAAGAEGVARPAGPLGPDQRADHLAARDQQAVHLRVDRVDLVAELGERPRVAFTGVGHGQAVARWYIGSGQKGAD